MRAYLAFAVALVVVGFAAPVAMAETPTRVLGLGENVKFGLGIGTNVGSPAPVVIDAPDGMRQVVSGLDGHSVAICPDGQVYAWGTNNAAQSGPSN